MLTRRLLWAVFTPKYVVIQPKRMPILVQAAGWVFCGVTILIAGVVSLARLEKTPQPIDLPQTYLPGNPVPRDISCAVYSGEYTARCYVAFQDQKIYLQSRVDAKTISRTFDPMQTYTLGHLVVAWGTPTGITWNASNIYVYWGLRSALLYTDAPQPDSPVDLIIYDLVASEGSPWRGFRRTKG